MFTTPEEERGGWITRLGIKLERETRTSWLRESGKIRVSKNAENKKKW